MNVEPIVKVTSVIGLTIIGVALIAATVLNQNIALPLMVLFGLAIIIAHIAGVKMGNDGSVIELLFK